MRSSRGSDSIVQVHADLDFDQVIGELDAAAGEGSYRGHGRDRRRRDWFFFGPNAAVTARLDTG